jgi:hypothetical protein
LTDDSLTPQIPLQFTFVFYGIPYTQIRAASNGFLTFSTGSFFVQDTATTFPGAFAGNPLISPWWVDLNPANAAAVSTIQSQTIGSAGSRIFVVQYINVPHYFSFTLNNVTGFWPVTFQVQLFESTGAIQFDYIEIATPPTRRIGVGLTSIAGYTGASWINSFVASLPDFGYSNSSLIWLPNYESQCSALTASLPPNCVAGTYLLPNFTSCDLCQLGQYCPGPTTTTTPQGPTVSLPFAFDCPLGTDCSVRGLITPATCPAGNYCPTPIGGGRACPTGSYCQNGAPTSCPIGRYCVANSTAPTSCPPESYCPAGGQSVPTPCPVFAACPTTQSNLSRPLSTCAIYQWRSTFAGVTGSDGTNATVLSYGTSSSQDWVSTSKPGLVYLNNPSRYTLGDDAQSGNISLGFWFPLFGVPYSNARLCTNGWLTLGYGSSTSIGPGLIPFHFICW